MVFWGGSLCALGCHVKPISREHARCMACCERLQMLSDPHHASPADGWPGAPTSVLQPLVEAGRTRAVNVVHQGRVRPRATLTPCHQWPSLATGSCTSYARITHMEPSEGPPRPRLTPAAASAPRRWRRRRPRSPRRPARCPARPRSPRLSWPRATAGPSGTPRPRAACAHAGASAHRLWSSATA